jgi:RimJ/RimL family protein N-acetyltransferase
MIYDHYEKGSIQMHVASDDPKYWTRRALHDVFAYPFYQLRVKKVIGVCNSENTRALSIHLRLGWELEAVVTDVYEMGDMYILSMTQEQCRWLRGKDNGLRIISSAAA